VAFVTRLRLTSGDRETLDQVVSELKATAERKGVKLTGPHSKPPTELVVPQYRRSPPGAVAPGETASETDDAVTVDPADETFRPWRYTVYARELEITGREEFVQRVANRDLPASVRMEVAVDRRAGAGG
jgi:ribosomal protein S10